LKLGILTALWQRPAISRVALDYYADPGLLPAGWDAALVAANSPASGIAAGHPWQDVYAPNSPLSDKWLAGLHALRRHGPDAVMVVGSDDLVSRGYVAEALREIERGADVVLLTGLRIYCIETRRAAMTWPVRMGAGRIISRRALGMIDWRLWPHGLDRRLDGGMDQRLATGRKVRQVLLPTGDSRACLDIKSADNMWSFEEVASIQGTREITTEEAWEGFETQAEALGITLTDMAKKPKHVGGGWYELPSGEKIQGKEAAEEAMQDSGAEDKPKADTGGEVELRALVNIPGSMAGQTTRIERGTTFTTNHTAAARLEDVSYAERVKK